MKLPVIRLSKGTRVGLFLALVLAVGSASKFALADDDNHGVDHSKGHSNDSPQCKKPPKGHGGGGDNGGNSNSGSSSSSNSSSNSSSTSNSSSSSNSSSTSNSSSSSNSSSTSNSTSSATGGNASATQSQMAQGGNATAGDQSNSQTTEFRQVRQAPMAYAPDAIPSAPCRVGGSAGVSAPIGGVSLGGSKMDNECDLRETARAFALIGNRGAAAKILCQTKAAKKAHLNESDCQALETAQAEPPAPSPVQIVMPSSQPAPPLAAVMPATAVPAPASDVVRQPEPRLLGICTFAKAITCKPEGKAPAVVTVSSICKQMLDAARKALRESPNSVLLVRGNRNPSEDGLTATARANNVKRQLTASGVDPDRVKVETGKGTERTVELVLVPQGEKGE